MAQQGKNMICITFSFVSWTIKFPHHRESQLF